MEIRNIEYRRKFNLGDYESEDYAVSALLEPDEDTTTAFNTLKKAIEDARKGVVSDEVEVKEPAAVVEEDDETEAEEEEEEVKPAAKKKNFKKKSVAYTRNNETHKMLFIDLLSSIAPDWKKEEKSKAKAKAASLKLEGVDFLDADGEPLEEFKAELKKLMK